MGQHVFAAGIPEPQSAGSGDQTLKEMVPEISPERKGHENPQPSIGSDLFPEVPETPEGIVTIARAPRTTNSDNPVDTRNELSHRDPCIIAKKDHFLFGISIF
jgi:hypothetical protein